MKNQKKKQRKPSLLISPNRNSEIKDLEGFKKIVLNEALEAIEHAINGKKKEVDLFELKDDCCYLVLDKQYYKPVLDKALKYFEIRQEFEKCARCKTLLDKML